MNILKSKWGLLFLSISFFIAACNPEDEKPATDYSSGVFIINDGIFQSGTGTVDFYNRQSTLTLDIYGKANNGASIGNNLQSMTIYNGKAYLIVNNAKKIIVVDPKTFVTQTEVTTGLNYPNYMIPFDKNRAYVSDWGTDGKNGSVKVYDIAANTIAKSISTTKLGAGKMLLTGQSLWVVNDSGLSFPAQDSTVSIINVSADTLLRTIKVDDIPNSIVQDANGDVWILCSQSLNRIRAGIVDITIPVPAFSYRLTTDISKNTLYFINGNKIYQKDLLNFGKNTPSVFLSFPYLSKPYSLGFDPKTGYMYCGDGKDFKSAGSVYIYDVTTKTLKDSLKTGVAPNSFLFL